MLLLIAIKCNTSLILRVRQVEFVKLSLCFKVGQIILCMLTD